jgi:ribosomal protein L7/L12
METFSEDNYLNLLRSGNKKEAILIYSEKNNCSRIEAETQMTNLESKYNIVQKSNTLDEELLRIIKSGRKIQAIKYYRDTVKCGLKEAKEYVDKLENPFSTGTKKEGCFINRTSQNPKI